MKAIAIAAFAISAGFTLALPMVAQIPVPRSAAPTTFLNPGQPTRHTVVITR